MGVKGAVATTGAPSVSSQRPESPAGDRLTSGGWAEGVAGRCGPGSAGPAVRAAW